MTADEPLLLNSGDLSICPERGEVANARGESTRLGPINMKVLALLLRRSGQVVSRAELFDTVWKNQVVGDDTLTRAISDIRAEVGALSDREGLIETLPKRGYRWTADVSEAPSGAGPAEPPLADNRPATGVHPPPPVEPKRADRHAVLVWGGRGAAYAAAFVLFASLAVWLMNELAGPGRQVIAVLPVAASPGQSELAVGIEQQLSDYLIRLDRVDLLSRSAVESRPSNPFPYFYYEFGASWLIESEIERLSDKTELILTLVDARTGIVLLQTTAILDDDASPSAAELEPAWLPLQNFFDSPVGR